MTEESIPNSSSDQQQQLFESHQGGDNRKVKKKCRTVAVNAGMLLRHEEEITSPSSVSLTFFDDDAASTIKDSTTISLDDDGDVFAAANTADGATTGRSSPEDDLMKTESSCADKYAVPLVCEQQQNIENCQQTQSDQSSSPPIIIFSSSGGSAAGGGRPESTSTTSGGGGGGQPRKKWVRRGSFTVETPSFTDLPNAPDFPNYALSDYTNAGAIPKITSDHCNSTNSLGTAVVPRIQQPDSSAVGAGGATALSKTITDSIISEKIVHKEVELLRRDGALLNFDVREIAEQVFRLKEMQNMLAEYHRLQIEDLKGRQYRETQTLKTQVDCMEAILSKMQLQNCRDDRFLLNNGAEQSIQQQKELTNQQSSTSRDLTASNTEIFAPADVVESWVKENCCKEKNNNKPHCHFNMNNKNHTITLTPTPRKVRPPSNNTKPKIFFKDDQSIPDVIKSRLAAFIKGYLLRRFLGVSQVKHLMTTIKDIRQQLLNLSKERSLSASDYQFAENLLQQLKVTLEEFDYVVFQTSTQDKMQLIASDRNSKSNCETINKIAKSDNIVRKKVSSATLKRIATKNRVNNSSLLSAQIVPDVTYSNNNSNTTRCYRRCNNNNSPLTIQQPVKRKLQQQYRGPLPKFLSKSPRKSMPNSRPQSANHHHHQPSSSHNKKKRVNSICSSSKSSRTFSVERRSPWR